MGTLFMNIKIRIIALVWPEGKDESDLLGEETLSVEVPTSLEGAQFLDLRVGVEGSQVDCSVEVDD
jgi:hypothetical protein